MICRLLAVRGLVDLIAFRDNLDAKADELDNVGCKTDSNERIHRTLLL